MSGETLWIAYCTIPVPNLSGLDGSQFLFFKGHNKGDLKNEHLRALLFADMPDGSKTFYDVRLTPLQDGQNQLKTIYFVLPLYYGGRLILSNGCSNRLIRLNI
jgi:hypothetical protein